jgi:hypothetical protein
MTRLERAIEKLKQLSKKEQNLFASMVLNEAVWQETFERSGDKLDKLGKSVLAEIREGKFKRMPGA